MMNNQKIKAIDEYQFIVDLGSLQPPDDQKKKLYSAIQKAITGELANNKLDNEMVLIPVSNWPVGRGPLINGIIIDVTRKAQLERLLGEGNQRIGNEQ